MDAEAAKTCDDVCIPKGLMRALLSAIERHDGQLGADGETRDAYTTELMWRRYELARARPPGLSEAAYAAWMRRGLLNAAFDVRRRRRSVRRRRLLALHTTSSDEVGAPCAHVAQVAHAQQAARLRRLLPAADFALLEVVAESGSVRAAHAACGAEQSLRTLYVRFERARARARAILTDGSAMRAR